MGAESSDSGFFNSVVARYTLGNCKRCFAAGTAGTMCPHCDGEPFKLIKMDGFFVHARNLALTCYRRTVHGGLPADFPRFSDGITANQAWGTVEILSLDEWDFDKMVEEAQDRNFPDET